MHFVILQSDRFCSCNEKSIFIAILLSAGD